MVKEGPIQQFKKQKEELKDWLYGTVYKEYDTEETAETVQEDVDRYFCDEWLEKLFSETWEAAQRSAANEIDKRLRHWFEFGTAYQAFPDALDEALDKYFTPTTPGAEIKEKKV